MADTKISGLTELAEAPNASDLVAVVDVSDTTQAGTGSTKKVSITNLAAAMGGGGSSNDALLNPVSFVEVSDDTIGIVAADSGKHYIVSGSSGSAFTLPTTDLTPGLNYRLTSNGITFTLYRNGGPVMLMNAGNGDGLTSSSFTDIFVQLKQVDSVPNYRWFVTNLLGADYTPDFGA